MSDLDDNDIQDGQTARTSSRGELSENSVQALLEQILQNQSKQSNQLAKVTAKVNEMYQFPDMDCQSIQSVLNDDDADNGEECDVHDISTMEYSEGEPLTKKPKTDVNQNEIIQVKNPLLLKFKDSLIKVEETDQNIDPEYAKIIDNLFQNGLEDAKFKDLAKSFKRPENVKLLQL